MLHQRRADILHIPYLIISDKDSWLTTQRRISLISRLITDIVRKRMTEGDNYE